MFVKYITVISLASAIAMSTGGVLWWLAKSRDYHRERSDALNKEILDLKAAYRLTENLREYNAELTRDQHDLQERVERAPSYDQPLPLDLLELLDQLHAGRTAIGQSP